MNTKRWSINTVIDEWDLILDKRSYELIVDKCEDIVNVHSKIAIFCHTGNYLWMVTCSNFFHKKQNCPCCNRGIKWTIERIKNEHRSNTKFVLVVDKFEKIKDYKSKICVKCINCLNESYFRCGYFYHRNVVCPYCSKGYKWTIEKVRVLLKKIKGFTLLEEKCDFIQYHNSRICVYCHKCETNWLVTCHDFFNGGNRCPQCNMVSKGEDSIQRYCLDKNINFNRGKKFDECKNINKLPFDFYLPDYNLLIEYQGPQHYKSVAFYGGITDFKSRQKRDKIKKEWAISNGYNFLEIPFTEFDNIDKVLDNYLLLNCIH